MRSPTHETGRMVELFIAQVGRVKLLNLCRGSE